MDSKRSFLGLVLLERGAAPTPDSPFSPLDPQKRAQLSLADNDVFG